MRLKECWSEGEEDFKECNFPLCYMRWCGNVGSAFHVKVTAVATALVKGYEN